MVTLSSDRYSLMKLRTKDRIIEFDFSQENIIVTGTDNLLSMPALKKEQKDVFGRNGSIETYGGYQSKSITLNISIHVEEHSSAYDVIDNFHEMLAERELELYIFPPARYLNVVYTSGVLDEEIGFRGLYYKGNITFSVNDPFWYSDEQKILVDSALTQGTSGYITAGNYFKDDSNLLTIDNVCDCLRINSGDNKGYYFITGYENGGVYLDKSITLATETGINYTIYSLPSFAKNNIGNIDFTANAGAECIGSISDESLITFSDYIKITPTFDGTISVDDSKILLNNGFTEYIFNYTDYPTVDDMVTAINAHSLFSCSYTGTEAYSRASRTAYSCDKFYYVAYEPVTQGTEYVVLLEDLNYDFITYPTIGDIKTDIDTIRGTGDLTYNLTVTDSVYLIYKCDTLVDILEKDVVSNNLELSIRDINQYIYENGDINTAGTFDVYPKMLIINKGTSSLGGFNVVRTNNDSGVIDARLLYFGSLNEDKLIEVDNENKTIKEYPYTLSEFEQYINNAYIDRIGKTTTNTDFIYLDKKNYTILIDTDNYTDMDIIVLIKWFDRYL